jgi:hypothetical protein
MQQVTSLENMQLYLTGADKASFSLSREAIKTNVTSLNFCVLHNFSTQTRLAFGVVVDVSDDFVVSTFVLMTEVTTIHYSLHS